MTAIVFLICFAGCCALALVRHPIYGLMGYVAVFYLNPGTRWWAGALPDLRWSLVAAGVTLLAVLLHSGKLRQGIPLFKQKLMVGLLVFVAWLGIQNLWALDKTLHWELFTIYAKFALLLGLLYKCIDSEKHLRYFLWIHVLGCEYLGWIAYTSYSGGRFEDFGGAGIGEANAGALQIVTGILAALALLLSGSIREKGGVMLCAPLILNGLVTTISRSGFLALITAAIGFIFFSPSKTRKAAIIVSVLAGVMLFSLTNDKYWTRIDTIKYTGEEVRGVDTGSGRLVLIKQQWKMFLAHPLGCGHRCTAVLSPAYLDDTMLTGEGATRARSSHNTFMTLLVEQGIVGAAFYVGLLFWMWRMLRRLSRQYGNAFDFQPLVLAASASILAAITVGDMFVDYLKFEGRIWFLGVLMVLWNLCAMEKRTEAEAVRPAKRPARAVIGG